MPGPASQHRRPVTMKEGATADDRRIIADAAIVNGEPTDPSDGVASQDANWLHLVMVHTCTSVKYKVWLYLGFSGEWVLLETIGTSGEVEVTTESHYKPVEIHGADRVYVELTDIVDPGVVDVWLGGNAHP